MMRSHRRGCMGIRHHVLRRHDRNDDLRVLNHLFTTLRDSSLLLFRTSLSAISSSVPKTPISTMRTPSTTKCHQRSF